MCSAAGGFILSRRYLSQGATGRAFAPRCAAERSPLRSELHALESSYKEVPKSNSLIDGTGYEVVDEDPEQPGIPKSGGGKLQRLLYSHCPATRQPPFTRLKQPPASH